MIRLKYSPLAIADFLLGTGLALLTVPLALIVKYVVIEQMKVEVTNFAAVTFMATTALSLFFLMISRIITDRDDVRKIIADRDVALRN